MNKPAILVLLLAGLLPTMSHAQTCTNTAMQESTPTSDFTIHADGTATHNPTGLIWKRCLEGQTLSDNGTPANFLDDQCNGSATAMNWQAALEQAQTVNSSGYAGQTDWRVPNLKELKSIVEYCRVSPAINTEVFPGSTSSVVWSSSPVVNDSTTSYAWGVRFSDGAGYWDDRDSDEQLRLVRSGQ